MRSHLKNIRRGAAVLATAFMLTGVSPNFAAFAQTVPPAPIAAALPESTVKALQEALNKQGIVVKVDGVLNEETRAAIRRYQSQHHLPVTGDPDRATLDKLGVRQGAVAADSTTTAQATPATPPSSGSPAQSPSAPASAGHLPGGMMSGPMMQGMMQMMQGMMGMMQGQMQHGSMQPGRMRGPSPQGGMMMNCPMMPGASQGDAPATMQMMQMMHGMMQMMQAMHGQMHPGQTQPGQMQPGQMQPGQMQPGQMQPGPMQGGPMQPGRN